MPTPPLSIGKNSITSVHSAAMASPSRENSTHRDPSSDDKDKDHKPGKTLATTAEEVGDDGKNSSHREPSSGDKYKDNKPGKTLPTTPEEVNVENRRASSQTHPHSSPRDWPSLEPNPHLLITPPTMKTANREPPTPAETAFLVILDIIEKLADREPRMPAESALLVIHDIIEPFVHDIIQHLGDTEHHLQRPPRSDGIHSPLGMSSLDSYTREYLNDPNFYDGRSKRSRRTRYSDQQRHAIMAGISELSLNSPASMRSTHSEERDQVIKGINERPYIPEFRWRDIMRWPAFIMSWPMFVWTVVHDSFATNPYKLHPMVYLALGTLLLWCIVTKYYLVVIATQSLWYTPWDRDAELECRRLMDMAVSIFPLVVQLVMFLFPPLIASTS